MLDPMASRFGQAAILSGLMNAESLMACWNAIPPEKREAPEHIDRRLARQAVQSKALTLWQAQQLLAGRTSGFQVDRYVLLELIGQGGMGRVYLARDTRLNRRVALKILAPERISNPRAVARFHREARVGAQLQHENLVRIYDFGESNGRFFLVMEYIEGKTIGNLISGQGPVPYPTAARLVRQVAQGLAHADRKGLIHRDVNPYNILVTHDGVAKLADLGLAIDLSEGDRVTREGATVGTFDYVAPEQARHSHSADIRSDIYSLGCTLYHMLTGHVPFPSPSLPEKLFAHHAMEPTPLEQIVPGLPTGMAEVVRKMMRKQPDERYSSPALVVQALETYIDEGAGGERIETVKLPIESPGPVSSGSAPSMASGSAPVSPPPDGDRYLPSGSAGSPTPATTIAAARNGGLLPANPAAVSAVAGASPLVDTDIDDPDIPLLTPTDDVVEEKLGLPIVLDLGPEPPLRPAASRPGPLSGVRLTSLFSQAGGRPSTAEMPGTGTSPLSRLLSSWMALPFWGRVLIPALSLAAILIAWLALTGRLSPPPGPPGSPSVTPAHSPTGEKGGPSGSTPTPRNPEATIFVRSLGVPAAEDTPVAFPTLAEALRAATRRGRDGYVELRNRDPLKLRPGDLPELHGQVDLRAAPGVRPVLAVEMDATRPFLVIGSAVSLKLSGLTFRVRYPTSEGATPAALPPVIQAAGRVQIERCAFEVDGKRPDHCRVLTSDGRGFSVDRSWFLGFDEAFRLKVYEETTAQIRRSMIIPQPGASPASGTAAELRGWAVAVDLLPGRGTPGGSKRKLTLERCTIEGAGLLAVTGDPRPSPLPVEISHCAVRAESLLAWQPRKPGDGLSADLLWQGEGNQFQVLGPCWVMMSAATMSPALSLGVTDLASWSKFVSRELGPLKTRILYRTDPHQRTASPEPKDFAIESSDLPADRAGADPEIVGPSAR